MKQSLFTWSCKKRHKYMKNPMYLFYHPMGKVVFVIVEAAFNYVISGIVPTVHKFLITKWYIIKSNQKNSLKLKI